jgi:glycosyltransferase involved in cell wall biosynthesis
VRVHVVGNICNNGFDLVTALRKLGVDAHLFLTWGDQAHPQTRPESGDPTLAAGYPPWIHEMKVPLARLRHRGSLPKQVRDELAACDVIHTHGHYAVWIKDSGTPYVIQPFGRDFFVLPFGRPPRSFRRLEDFLPDYRLVGFKEQIRDAYRKSSAIVLMNVDHLWERAYTTLVPGRKVAAIGLIVDTDLLSPGGDDADRPPVVAQLRKEFELLLFQPTRQIWTPAGRRENAHYSYGNDLFLRGLAVAVRGGASAVAILVDRGNRCTEASKALIAELGIQRNVRWVREMRRHELLAYYRHTDVTVDAFYAGGFGSACLEAMACASPVLMYYDEASNRAVFGEVAPVVNARNVDEIAARIRESASPAGRAALAERGRGGRAFVERHHASRAVAPKYAALYASVMKGGDPYPFADPSVYLALRSPLPPAPPVLSLWSQ